MEHEADHRQSDHRFRDLLQRLVILGQPPPSPKPAERSFDHPSPRLHDEAGPACGTADDDQRQAEQKAGEQSGKPVVDAVGKRGPESTSNRRGTARR